MTESALLADALEAHQAGDREAADALYRQALDAEPHEPTALYLYGLLNFELGRADRAVELFEAVVVARPDHAEAQATLAALRHWRGEPAAAAEGYRRTLALEPGRLDAAVGLANALREAGDAGAASEAAADAVARFPSEAGAHIALGAAQMGAGDSAAAAEAYNVAAVLDPARLEARLGLALALLQAGRAGEALDAALAATAIEPASPDAWFASGAALRALRQTTDAIAALERAAALDPTRAATQLELGAAHADADNAAAAEGALVAALVLDATLAEAHASLSSVYLRAGRPLEAERSARRALALDPDMAQAHQNLASLLAEQGFAAEARRHRDRAYAGRNLFVEPAADPLMTVLMITTAESGNVPLDHLMPRARFSRVRWVIEYADAAQEDALPPHDLVFNAIGDPDLAPPAMAPMRRFLSGAAARVLNPPEAVERTRRDRLPALFAGLDRVTVPAVARLSAEGLADEGLAAALARGGIAPPLLLRPAASHGGRDLRRIESAEELKRAQARGDHYATAFQDYRSADGFYRKYRMIFVDRRPFAYHLAIGPDWMVHHGTAGMGDDALRRAEEVLFLDDPVASLGPEAMTAIAEIGWRLDLDYAGVDFSLTGDGRVLVFEANATMLVHPEAPDGVFAYKNPAVARIVEAFQQMLERSARA